MASQSMNGNRVKHLFQDKTNNEPQFIIAKQIYPAKKQVNQQNVVLQSQTASSMYPKSSVNQSGISNYSN